MDELKRKQLMELAIINGTYRPYHKVGSIRESFLPYYQSPYLPNPHIPSCSDARDRALDALSQQQHHAPRLAQQSAAVVAGPSVGLSLGASASACDGVPSTSHLHGSLLRSDASDALAPASSRSSHAPVPFTHPRSRSALSIPSSHLQHSHAASACCCCTPAQRLSHEQPSLRQHSAALPATSSQHARSAG